LSSGSSWKRFDAALAEAEPPIATAAEIFHAWLRYHDDHEGAIRAVLYDWAIPDDDHRD
jgi:hypothetical protein